MMFTRIKNEITLKILLAVLSAVLLALAFPKFNFCWLAWIALVPFFIALRRSKSLKESLLCGFFFGVCFFGVHLFWVNTLFRFVRFWIVPGWVSLVLFQTLFILLFVAVLESFKKNAGQPLIAALLWTAIEWLRARGPFGVTGGDLGYSQAQLLPLIQIASFTSVYGVSFLILLFNASAAQFVTDKKRWHSMALALVLILIATGYGRYVLNKESGAARRSVKLALIQPNIDQKDKLDAARMPAVFDVHREMTLKALQQKPDIIIWPETAIFTYLLHDQELLGKVEQLVVESSAWLVLGTPHYIGSRAYNSIVSFSPSGEVVSRYDKQRLVPFGEYLPFRSLLYPFLKGVGYYETEFSPNPRPQVLKVGDLNLAAAICFESVFPHIIKERTSRSADFILLVTNDAWFGDSSALYFHLNAGVFRAIENRKYFVGVGNTGVTAVIGPYGRILEKTGFNQREILTFEIPLS